MFSSTEGMTEAASSASPGIPAPIAVEDKCDLKDCQSKSQTSNFFDFGDFEYFEYFPFFPLEIRTMIWKLAIPRPKVITVTVHVKNCDEKRVSRKYGCHDKSHDFQYFTFAVQDNQFGVMMVCKESRHLGLQALPKALPTACFQLAGIRYNPEDTAIRITNFREVLVSFGEYNGNHDSWLCPRTPSWSRNYYSCDSR
jgi:hypothetical protein